MKFWVDLRFKPASRAPIS
ncbi:hypothetical protein A2U01_0113112, partial [Trifolium medium]|nr:hypothetical protein [Trifolium medium]